MIRYLEVVILLIWLGQPVSAQDEINVLLLDAETAYNAGDYSTAISIYEALVDAGLQDWTLYFNLGHAYYQVGDLGHAMLYYRRAQEYLPRDGELGLSLARVRSRRVDIQGEEAILVDSLAALTVDSLSLKEFGWLVLILWTLWFGGVAVYIQRTEWRELLRIGLMVVGGMLFIGCVLLGSRMFVMANRPPAVVVIAASPVMSGPGEAYLEHYRIHAGAEIHILERRGEWVRFSLPDGRQGWVIQSAIELV